MEINVVHRSTINIAILHFMAKDSGIKRYGVQMRKGSSIGAFLFKRNCLVVVFMIQALLASSQDIEYARYIIDTLSSPAFDGRGYVNEGDRKASEFIAGQFKKFKLKSFGHDYFQPYSFPMNILPGRVEVALNGNQLSAGDKYQVWAANPSIKGKFKVVYLKKKDMVDPVRLSHFASKDLSNKFVCIDKKGIGDKKVISMLDSLRFTNFIHAKGLLFLSDRKLTWSVMAGYQARNYSVLDIRRDALSSRPRIIELDIESFFVEEYETRNVIGYIPGKVAADTFLVLTAHFDHLGRMGKEVYFPGANDNASGTSMVLDFARYYSLPENQPYYSLVFICLSGEEAGLHGSNYCADHSPFPLTNAKFLINLDMVGTGSEGITVVNATRFKKAYQRLATINSENEYLLTVKERGESCNSDHCPFFKKGVPAFFIYSKGKEFNEYHNQDDRSRDLPLTEYADIFRLVRDFIDGMR